MAWTATTSTTEAQDKTVTGYPAQPSQIAAGYPPPTTFPVTTAYPYAVPPPAVFSQTYHPPSPPRWRYYRDGGRSTLLCRLVSAVFAVLFAIAIFFFIIWLILKPRLPEFQVDSASVAPLNVTKTELSATWDITFRVRNPNEKLSVYYHRIEAWVVYGEEDLLYGTDLPPFYQEKRNETTVEAQLAVVSDTADGYVLRAISEEKARGLVSFDVRVLALINFRKGVWQTRRHLLRASCEGVIFGFSAPNNGTGTLMGGPRACKVGLLLAVNSEGKTPCGKKETVLLGL
ncbi:hypothetical protein L1049_009374 [Liquidambar formosana]|uniref:Late embryogenesis abundant protein LEA-2 subgroup domain-containing protein n=1 Tax=Liquidambar formosana TaxID=63359 RepID=A0AAP0S4X2_LIQFO